MLSRSTYKRRGEEGATIGVAATAEARAGKERFRHSGGDSTSAATSSFHGVAIPPLRWPAAAAGGGTGRSWAAESRRWAAAQLLVAQMGAKIALVGGGGTT